MNTFNILIAGDSWGRGEWNKNIKVVHQGLEKYLQHAGHTVTNVSKPGGTLEEIYDIIKSQDLSLYDIVFVFVTDTNRSVTKKYTQQENFFKLDPFCRETIIQRHNTVLTNFFNDLDKLDKEMYLLGGLSNIIDIKCKNVKVAIPSILRLILPEIAKNYEFFFHLGNRYHSNMDRDTINWMWKQNKIWESVQKSKYFQGDGWHPNRKAHKIIYKYLEENVIKKVDNAK